MAGKDVFLFEDTAGVWVEANGVRTSLSRSSLKLPSFAGNKYATALKVLHRDGAMMGMVLKESPNSPKEPISKAPLMATLNLFTKPNGSSLEWDSSPQSSPANPMWK